MEGGEWERELGPGVSSFADKQTNFFFVIFKNAIDSYFY